MKLLEYGCPLGLRQSRRRKNSLRFVLSELTTVFIDGQDTSTIALQGGYQAVWGTSKP